jgi:lysophospholipase L1-like esterase
MTGEMRSQLESFAREHHPSGPARESPRIGLRPGDRILLAGDSITEANRYSRMVETYLAACHPGLGVEFRNIGKGGETAGQFLERLEADCLAHGPDVVAICYGMNDSAYTNHNRPAAARYRDSMASILDALGQWGCRTILASPGCIGKLPPWQFVADQGGTIAGLNATLLEIRDQAASLAAERGLPFVDHFWNLLDSALEGNRRYGPGFELCGADDGVHPSWAGHAVMAHGLLAAMGFDGDLGSIEIDLASGAATATGGHAYTGIHDGTYRFTSHRQVFCAEGRDDRDWSLRAGMGLVPFDSSLNRLTLRITGTKAPACRIWWMNDKRMPEERHVFTASRLEAGINLAAEFRLNPFTPDFRRVEGLVYRKQLAESRLTWREWDPAPGLGLADGDQCEARRRELLGSIRSSVAPVSHTLRIEELS